MRHRHYNLSAIRSTGFCLECGVKLEGRRRKYCSAEHANAYFARYDYKGMVREVLKRDNYTCRLCGAVGGELEVAHITPLADGGALLDMANCRTLCRDCHKKETAEWHRLQALKRRYGAAVREAPRDEAERKEEPKQLALF